MQWPIIRNVGQSFWWHSRKQGMPQRVSHMDLSWRRLLYFIPYFCRISCKVLYVQAPYSFVPHLTLRKTPMRNLNTEGNKNNSGRRWITSSFFLIAHEQATADVTQHLHQCCVTQKTELTDFQTTIDQKIFMWLCEVSACYWWGEVFKFFSCKLLSNQKISLKITLLYQILGLL